LALIAGSVLYQCRCGGCANRLIQCAAAVARASHRIVKSHTCEFTIKALAPLVAWPCVVVVAFGVLMHVGASLRLLPTPRPTLDTERTVLLHQADAARTTHNAEIVLLGDSSCLMNVSARQLNTELGRRALNLGTFSFLDVNAHASMLREYAQANPGKLRTVVLLMHAESLRRLSAEPYYVEALENFWADQDQSTTGTIAGQVNRALGVDIFKGRLLSRALPLPLGGAYGRRYGFTRDLESALTAESGSVIDPDPQPLTGTAEYRLAPTLEKTSRNLRTAVPPGVTLLVGITPAPERFAGARYPAQQAAMLQQWAGWLGAIALTNLPAALPDSSFVRTTHLTESVIPAYTTALAKALEPHLR